MNEYNAHNNIVQYRRFVIIIALQVITWFKKLEIIMQFTYHEITVAYPKMQNKVHNNCHRCPRTYFHFINQAAP